MNNENKPAVSDREKVFFSECVYLFVHIASVTTVDVSPSWPWWFPCRKMQNIWVLDNTTEVLNQPSMKAAQPIRQNKDEIKDVLVP